MNDCKVVTLVSLSPLVRELFGYLAPFNLSHERRNTTSSNTEIVAIQYPITGGVHNSGYPNSWMGVSSWNILARVLKLSQIDDLGVPS